MPIPQNNIHNREYDKFVECPTGQTAVATCDSTTHDKLDVLAGTTNTTTTIINLSLPTANTEVSQALPASTKSFSIRNRDKKRLQLAFVATESGTNFITIMPGFTYTNKNFYTNQTIYLQCSTGSQTIEIEAHS